MDDQNLQEIWQVNVNGEIYETNFENLENWIAEGSLQPHDKVRRGNLRWLEAGKIPFLNGFFNAKGFGIVPPVLTMTVSQSRNNNQIESDNFTLPISNLYDEMAKKTTESNSEFLPNPAKIERICSIHLETESSYICDSCTETFCKNCPKTQAGVKICPICGAACKPILGSFHKQRNRSRTDDFAKKNLGFADFAKSLIYPFKFKTSLIFGTILFTVFLLGQSVWVYGGIMLAPAFFCAMLANTLTFGILANTVENFSQGKTDSDFIPRFDDFSAWDDVVHPFLLSIGVYIISFGLLLALIVGAAWYAVNSMSEIDVGKDRIVSKVLPVPPDDLKLMKQSEQVGKLTEQFKKQNKFNNGNLTDENVITESSINAVNEAMIFEKLQNQINTAQTEPPKPAANDDLSQMPANIMRLSLIFSIPIFLAFLWGIFYFPAACVVAAYTRSFTATLNPLIGFDTIKRLGFDYAKIIGMLMILGSFAVVMNSVLGSILSPFDLPQIGNLAVKTVDGILYFYISIVFSVALGFLIYRNSRKLNLFRS